MRLLIATHNEGKRVEYAALLCDLGPEIVSLADLGVDAVVEEDGASYAENALLKARGYAFGAGLVTLADDSGLEVDGLNGAPGIHSARYGGSGVSDAERCMKLLREMECVPDGRRGARFRCVIALVWPDGREETVEGTCEGWIARQPRGENGFGYDPVFYIPEYECTMAELPTAVKNRISHRARAAAAALRVLRRS